MKLSEKGKENLAGFGFAYDCDGAMALLDDYEFEPDDFEGMVCLTVEEAKLLFKVIDGFFDLRLPTTKEIVALNKLKVRVERIAKAEQGHEVE